jgi:hypothetical protein
MNYPVKNALRQLVCKVYDAATKDKQTITTVSLPGDCWEFEHYINDNYNFRKWFGYAIKELKSYCFEKNKIVFNTNQQYSKDLTESGIFEYLNEEINEIPTIWAKSECVFSWFDFCGNPTFFNLDYCNNKTAKQTHLLTFNLAWRCSDNIPTDILTACKYQTKQQAVLDYLQKVIDTEYKEFRYQITFSIPYVSNHTPMILICITNDIGVIIEDYGLCQKTEKLPDPPALIKVQKDKQDIYSDLLSGMSDAAVMDKHSLKTMQLAAHKAWLTMWGKW